MNVIKEITENTYTYARRRNELFDILDKAIIDAIVEKGMRFEPVDVNELNWWDKYRVNLIAEPKVGAVRIDMKKEHS